MAHHGSRPRRRPTPRHGLTAAVVVAAGGLWAAVAAHGQRVVFVNGVATIDDGTQTNKSSQFSVRKEPQPVADAFDDFERYRDKAAWEKAFAALGKIDDAKASGDRLVGGTNGFLVTAAVRLRNEMLSLPPAGRQAFRLFNDAGAEKLFADATAGPNGDDVPALRRVVDRYFITSVGDRAADRLGDALFEAGDFVGADRCWQLILDSYPDSQIPAPLLLAKRGTALARAGSWGPLDAVRAAARDRYAGQAARVGGKDIAVDALLDELRKAGPGGGSPATADGVRSTWVKPPEKGAAPLTLPASDVPTWQVPLMTGEVAAAVDQQLAQYGWGSLGAKLTQAVPPSYVDEKRVYCNWLGIAFAVDVRTGKMLWRTDPFGDLAQKLIQSVMQGEVMDTASAFLVPAGPGRILIGQQVSGENRSWNESVPMRLVCLTTDKGSRAWATTKGAGSDLNVAGAPVIDGDAVYFVAMAGSTQELNLCCFGADKGEQRWRLPLGRPAMSTNSRGQPVAPAATLLVRGDKVDVLTNNGALLEVDRPGRRIDWAFAYPTAVKQEVPYYYRYTAPAEPVAPGAIVSQGSTLYFKESGGTSLFAIETGGVPAVLWQRTADGNDGLAAVGDDRLMLLGGDAEVLSMAGPDHTMLWGESLSTKTGNLRPVLAGGHCYVLGDRGVHDLLLADGSDGGRLFRGYEPGGSGGAVWPTPARLITVSSRAITAYPAGPAPPPVAKAN